MTDPKEAAETSEGDNVDEPLVRRSPEWPEFLEDFPDSPELQPLIQTFVAGNYARLRELERALRARGADSETLECARELVDRTQTHPTAKKLLFLSIGFFLFLVVWVYMEHAH
jgi:hypothetical protein